jgi:peptidoglycan/LPS O-acetylase OafA/YrhL
MANLNYIKPLDAIRGIGCSIVVMFHWPFDRFRSPVGWEWLQYFFVMSGFLITRILLNEKAKHTFKNYLQRFYTKRAYRIFPVYFGFIFFWFLVYLLVRNNAYFALQFGEIKRNFVYLITYTYNFMPYVEQIKGGNPNSTAIFGHVWSLSVEEQFYFVFPFIVYFLSTKNLKRLLLFIVIFVPILRIWGYYHLMGINPSADWVSMNLYHLTPFQIDSLAFGALLSIVDMDKVTRADRWTIGFLVLLFANYILQLVFGNLLHGDTFASITSGGHIEKWIIYNQQYIYLFSLVNLLSYFSVMAFIKGQYYKPLFENKLFCYLGKISYGLYIYHLPIAGVMYLLLKKLKLVPLIQGFWWAELALLLIYWMVLIAITHLSFNYFESFFLNLKSKMDTKSKTNTTQKQAP